MISPSRNRIIRMIIAFTVWGLAQGTESRDTVSIGGPEGSPTVATEAAGLPAKDVALTQPSPTTADHRKFEALKREFKTGPEVTKACLSCHTEAARQVHRTIHWTWRSDKGEQAGLGKANAVNNF